MVVTRTGKSTDTAGAPPEKKKKDDEDTDEEMDKSDEAPPKALPPLDTSKSSAGAGNTSQASGGGGGGFPGLNETMGLGGGGGGLAGAGNNEYFHGFAKSTVPRDPPDYEYVDTYRRPFQIHTEFQSPNPVGATVYGNPVQFNDSTITAPFGYKTKKYKAEVTHNAIHIPYWIMEASMKDHDWNKPPDHIAYQLLEIGFDIPNLRLNIMNNPRSNVNDVAPAPPADARLWTFVDVNNDYGILQNMSTQDISHNQRFQLEDFIQADSTLYNLPYVPTRTLFLDAPVASQILHNRNWVYNDTTVTSTSQDPHDLYDMKRHPGYKEFEYRQDGSGGR